MDKPNTNIVQQITAIIIINEVIREIPFEFLFLFVQVEESTQPQIKHV